MADVPFSDVAELPYGSPDATHRYGDAAPQFGEYWSAPEDAPLVFLIHGGCWLNAYGLDHIRPLASELAERGMAVFSVEYRRIGDSGGGFPGTLDDINAALSVAQTLGHKKIVLAGHSAGGHLALWLAASNKGSTALGAIGLAAISDMDTYAAGNSSCEKAALTFMGGAPEAVPDHYRIASPMLLDNHIHTHLIHGSADRIVDPDQSAKFVERHSAATVTMLRDQGHFDMIDPRQSVPQLIEDKIAEWLAN